MRTTSYIVSSAFYDSTTNTLFADSELGSTEEMAIELLEHVVDEFCISHHVDESSLPHKKLNVPLKWTDSVTISAQDGCKMTAHIIKYD